MENELKMDDLVKNFKTAEEHGALYVAVVVQMEGFKGDEIIINPKENFASKLEYYQKTYDENLNHRFAPGISITGFTYGKSFDILARDLLQ